MAENEANVISHLLEVETVASNFVENAQIEANKRVLSAKTQADEIFHSKYAEILKDFESQYEQKVISYKNEHEQIISTYKEKLFASQKDVNSFNGFLDKLFANS